MHVIRARNVNDAYQEGMLYLDAHGVRESTRNGEAIVAPEPVTTRYERPWERVLFNAHRDANPFFHLMESIWMLAGRRDVDWLAHFNSGMRKFSDDGINFHGAYGYRLRHHFGMDQLSECVRMLKENPDDRRVVCSIWHPVNDLGMQSKDIPCNDAMKFDIRDGKLCMYVFNRSNDAVWGCYGANAVHFPFFQEYVASRVGVEIGAYYQISTNFHAYSGIYEAMLENVEADMGPYDSKVPLTPSQPIISDPDFFDDDLHRFFGTKWVNVRYSNRWFTNVAVPMRKAWCLRKENGLKTEAYDCISREVTAADWRHACLKWLERRDQ